MIEKGDGDFLTYNDINGQENDFEISFNQIFTKKKIPNEIHEDYQEMESTTII